MSYRKVIVSKHVQREIPGDAQRGPRLGWVLEPAGEALFHQFGVNYEEFESGAGNFTTAVVEWPDGKIENVPVERIQFVEPTREQA